MLLIGCAGASPTVETQAEGTAAAAAAPEPEPVDPAEQVEDEAQGPDPRETGLVSVSAVFREGREEVWREAREHEATVAACFDRVVPLERRSEGTLYLTVLVPNPDFRGDSSLTGLGSFEGGFGGGGVQYSRPGTYPELERCVAERVGRYSAPDHVREVSLRIQIHTRSHSYGIRGRGAPRR